MKTKLNNQKGFTIIEVLIVLAIAGLILLIVLLAVPALQRSQRNTSRKADVGRIGSAATEFVANQNGTLPTAASVPHRDKIIATAGNLGQYDFTASPGNFAIVAQGTANANDVDKIQLAVNAKCTEPIDGTTTSGTARQMAVQYTVETGRGGTDPLCVDL